MGIRPTVRGSVMNPNDHPHGGGEGKAGIGRVSPVTPWGLSLIHIYNMVAGKRGLQSYRERRDTYR